MQLRERLALTQSVVGGFLQEVAEHAEVHEAVVISTCNHTELSLVVGDPVLAESAALGMHAQRAHARSDRARRADRLAAQTVTPRAICFGSAAASCA